VVATLERNQVLWKKIQKDAVVPKDDGVSL